MNRPTKSTSTACTKLELYCDFLEEQLKTPAPQPIPCNNILGFIGTCSQCRTPVCHYCGKCTNPNCRIFGCNGGK